MKIHFNKRERSLVRQLFAEHLLCVRIALNEDNIQACPHATPRLLGQMNKRT